MAAGAGAVTTIVPVGVKQSGCTVTLAVGAAGFPGTALIVKLVGNETQPVVVLVVVTAYVPGARLAKVLPDCVIAGVTGLVPVMVYVTLAAGVGAVTTIVPVGVKQSGCTVTLAVGAAGLPGTALIF